MSEATTELIQSSFTILGGLGLFLYGMTMMSDGLENMAGERMRVILERTTSNRFLGIIVGAIVTCVMQSSSATTVMVVGFVNAKLMNLTQAIGVIMGANIGTTITAQIISFKIDAIAPLIIFLGFLLHFMPKKRSVRNLGLILLGFGILFFGISVMGNPLKELGKMPWFSSMMATFKNPLLALIVGIVFTAIVQSSSATTGIIIALYLSGVDIQLQTAAFLVLGSNIGTCITAMLSSIPASRESKRTALAHVLFNTIGSIFFGSLIVIFPGILTWIQQTWPDGARQVAMFHTMFNFFTVILLLPFVKQLAILVQRIIPEKADEHVNTKRLIYLDPGIIQTPTIAVSQSRRELCRMGHMACNNLQMALDAFFNEDIEKAENVMEIEETIDFLNHQITGWLVRVRGLDLSVSDIEKLGMMLHTISDIERIGDHAVNIAEYAVLEGQNRAKITHEAMDELAELSKSTMEIVTLALEVFENSDDKLIPQVDILEDHVDKLAKDCIENHIKRLTSSKCDPRGGVVYTDMVIDLERCADHANNIANSLTGEEIFITGRNKLLRNT